MTTITRPLSEIAREAAADMSKNLKWQTTYYAAVPYLAAMRAMNSIDSPFFQDDGKSVVRYFLANATSWRGPVARAIKAELKSML